MTLVEMLQRVADAGFPCDRYHVRRLIEEGLLPEPTGGGQGRGNAADYSEECLLRLLIVERLRQDPPAGFGVTRFDRLREWVGNADNPRVDEALAAIAYVLGVPGVPEDEARRAASRSVKREMEEIGRSHREFVRRATDGKRTSRLGEELLAFSAGDKALCDPDFHRATGTDGRLSVFELLASALRFPTRDPVTGISLLPKPETAAILCRSHAPRYRERCLRNASRDVIQEAAYVAMLLLPARAPVSVENPRALALVRQWTIWATLLYLSPVARQLFQFLKQATDFFGLETVSALSEEPALKRRFRRLFSSGLNEEALAETFLTLVDHLPNERFPEQAKEETRRLFGS